MGGSAISTSEARAIIEMVARSNEIVEISFSYRTS